MRALCAFVGKTVVLPSPSTTLSVSNALLEIGGNFKHVALMFTVGNAIKKKGVFSNGLPGAKVFISFTDTTQGAVFWYIVRDFLVWGVEKNLFNLPGLETAEDDEWVSNLTKVQQKCWHQQQFSQPM